MNKITALEAIHNKALSQFSKETELEFKCFTDNTLVFGITIESIYHEINIICDSDLFAKMTIKELLNAKRITLISYSIFNKLDRSCDPIAFYSANNESNLN